jgi:hypothetical protein
MISAMEKTKPLKDLLQQSRYEFTIVTGDIRKISGEIEELSILNIDGDCLYKPDREVGSIIDRLYSERNRGEATVIATSRLIASVKLRAMVKINREPEKIRFIHVGEDGELFSIICNSEYETVIENGDRERSHKKISCYDTDLDDVRGELLYYKSMFS